MLAIDSYGVSALTADEAAAVDGGCTSGFCEFLHDVAAGAAYLTHQAVDFARGLWNGLFGS